MKNQVALGRFGSPFGILGWIKVISYTDPVDNILNYSPWIVVFNDNTQLLIKEVKGKIHGNNLVVTFGQCKDRNQAQTYTNLEIYVDRAQLPPPSNDEYYWIDLIGLSVSNSEGEQLGLVKQVFATGSNDVLIVKEENGKEHYIPYIKDVILEVNLEISKLIVDWDPTF